MSQGIEYRYCISKYQASRIYKQRRFRGFISLTYSSSLMHIQLILCLERAQKNLMSLAKVDHNHGLLIQRLSLKDNPPPRSLTN